MKFKTYTREFNSGFTLIESLIAIGIFAIVGGGLYFAYSNILDITIAAEINSTALTVINNELEVVRNIEYTDIGIQGGAPAGILPSVKNINFSGFNFILNTTVRNIDDPFDGILGGIPNDTAPADYKIVELELECSSCSRYIPIVSTAIFSPANIEGSSNNGNLFINAINASGDPVIGANVSIANSSIIPSININDVTNNSGQLQLVDIATSSLGYGIIVTKPGYSTDRTYHPGIIQNPNPVKPDATVVSQQVTLITFSIDRLSTQTLNTRDKFCRAVGGIDFTQQGSRFIGTDPDILKYSAVGVTNASGQNINSLIEWDNYTIQNIDSAYDLAGTTLLSPFNVNPNTNYSFNWLVEPKNNSSLLVVVQDGAGQFLNEASMSLTRIGFSQLRTSGHNYFNQTDWSGGQFSQKSANIDESTSAGDIRLMDLGGGKYASLSLEWIESSTFDLGAAANFYRLSWNPISQPMQSGVDSLKFQLAANNDNSTWNYVGPDGSPSTYYSLSDSAIFNGHSGNRYFRYKAYFWTEDHDYTPLLSDISIDFSSSCLPDGQVFFSGLSPGSYNLTIEKQGYQIFTVPINIGSGWHESRITLQP